MLLPPRSGAVVAWGNALLAGACGPDDAAAGITGSTAVHRVLGIPGERGAVSWAWALVRLRSAGATGFRLVLPVPGDPRGLPGPPATNAAALAAGEGAVAYGTPGALLLVPADADPAHPQPERTATSARRVPPGGSVLRRTDSRGSSVRAAGQVRWQCLPTTIGADAALAGRDPDAADAPDQAVRAADQAARAAAQALRAADQALRAALREAASELNALGLDRARPDAARQVDLVERVAAAVALPPTLPPTAVAVLRSGVRVLAIVELAGQDDGAAVTAAEADRRRAALAPLLAAARDALVAAYGAGIGPAPGSDRRARGQAP